MQRNRKVARIPLSPEQVEEERRRYHEKMRARLASYRDSQPFNERILNAKKLLGRGVTLSDVQEKIGCTDPERADEWEVLKYALAISYFSPETTLLEWSAKHRRRYQMAMDVYKKSHKGEPAVALGAIKVMLDLDKNDLEIKKMFGLLKPVMDPLTGGEGYRDEDRLDAGQPNAILEELRRNIRALAAGKAPVPSDVLDGPDARAEGDLVGEAAVDANPPVGSKS